MAKNPEQPIRCSFCGKRETQVTRLIAGPGVYICSDCVQACSELLHDDIIYDEEGLEVAGMDGFLTIDRAREAGDKKFNELRSR